MKVTGEQGKELATHENPTTKFQNRSSFTSSHYELEVEEMKRIKQR